MDCPTCRQPCSPSDVSCKSCGVLLDLGPPEPEDGLALRSGALLAGKYRIEMLLGTGGFGVTYKALRLSDKQLVAVKELFLDGSSRSGDCVTCGRNSMEECAQAKRAFLNEADSLRRFSGPQTNPESIVDVYEVFEQNQTVYMVQEFVAGQTLQQAVEASGPLKEPEAVEILSKVAKALYLIHGQGLLHRDIKPSNIILRHQTHEPVVIDFGAARTYQKGRTQRHTRVASDGYAPPEQYQKEARVDCSLDLYALSATGFFMLTGSEPPSAMERLQGVEIECRAAFSAELGASIKKTLRWGLEMAPGNRPPNAFVFAQALTGKIEPSPYAVRIAEILQQIEHVTIGPDAPKSPYDNEIAQVEKQLAGLSAQSAGHDGDCPVCLAEMQRWPVENDRHCFACRSGTLQTRDLRLRACPLCHQGVLTRIESSLVCPLCQESEMVQQPPRWDGLTPISERKCRGCGAILEARADRGTLRHPDPAAAADLPGRGYLDSPRPEWQWHQILPPLKKARCGGCGAEVVKEPSGLCRVTAAPTGPPGRWDNLIDRPVPERDLACMSLGLSRDAGDIGCSNCGLELRRDTDGLLSVLRTGTAEPAWMSQLPGEPTSLTEMYRIELGKSSTKPGFVCPKCSSEFDVSGEEWTLCRTGSAPSAAHLPAGKSMSRLDWFRLTRSLPSQREELQLRTRLKQFDDRRRTHLQSYINTIRTKLQKELEELRQKAARFAAGKES